MHGASAGRKRFTVREKINEGIRAGNQKKKSSLPPKLVESKWSPYFEYLSPPHTKSRQGEGIRQEEETKKKKKV